MSWKEPRESCTEHNKSYDRSTRCKHCKKSYTWEMNEDGASAMMDRGEGAQANRRISGNFKALGGWEFFRASWIKLSLAFSTMQANAQPPRHNIQSLKSTHQQWAKKGQHKSVWSILNARCSSIEDERDISVDALIKIYLLRSHRIQCNKTHHTVGSRVACWDSVGMPTSPSLV